MFARGGFSPLIKKKTVEKYTEFENVIITKVSTPMPRAIQHHVTSMNNKKQLKSGLWLLLKLARIIDLSGRHIGLPTHDQKLRQPS